MKIIKYISVMLIPCLVLVTMLISSCEDEDGFSTESPNGAPSISFIRMPDATKSDSLLVSASLGTNIFIVGENLGGIQQVWFNDRRATLNPTFVTNSSIYTTVPNLAPETVVDHLFLISGTGDTLAYPFKVIIAPPRIDRFKSEFVPDGGELVIQGDFFFGPISVMLPGEIEANISSFDQNEIRVVIPEGLISGTVSVTTNFGNSESKQIFRDNRGIFGGMEQTDFTGWWHGGNRIVASATDIPNISGNFMRVVQTLTVDPWFEYFVGNGGTLKEGTKTIPDDAILNPEDYTLKFEVFTINPILKGANMRFYVGNDIGLRETQNFPWILDKDIDTKGEWETLSIPFSTVVSKNSPAIAVNADGYDISFWFWQSTVAMNLNFAVDNFRVVPN